MRSEAAVGVTLAELDEVAHEILRKAGARSPFLHYHPSFAPTPFPAVICASVNDVIVHGIPDGYRLRDGDLVSVDFGATLDGWTGDAAVSFIVGTANPADELLIETTEKALAAGIAAAAEGGRLGDISSAIGTLARAAGIHTPLLIAQGANDPRVKQAESEQIVAALRDAGIDYEYMLFPDEGHGFAKPSNRLRFYAAAERFLARHLGGRAEE